MCFQRGLNSTNPFLKIKYDGMVLTSIKGTPSSSDWMKLMSLLSLPEISLTSTLTTWKQNKLDTNSIKIVFGIGSMFPCFHCI